MESENVPAIPQPSPQERIQRLGQAKVHSFLDDVPRESLTKALRHFRSRSRYSGKYKEGIKRSDFEHALADRGPAREDSPQWATFVHLWMIYARTTFGPSAPIPDDQDGMKTFLEWLIEPENFVAREQIERALQFAPFNVTPEQVAMVAVAPTRQEVDAEQRQRAVITRIDGIEARLRDVTEVLRNLEQVMSTSSSTSTQSDYSEHIAGLLESTRRLETKVIEARVLRDREAVECATQIAEVRATAADAARASDVLKGRVQPIESRLPLLDSQVQHLSRALEELRQNGVPHDGRLVARPCWRHIPAAATSGSSVASVGSPEALVAALRRILDDVGISKAALPAVAIEMAAAIVARQWIVLAGSMALELARTIASALCRSSALQTTVSFAQSDPIEFPTAAGDVWRAVIIEGVNRGPIELVASEFRLSYSDSKDATCAKDIVIGVAPRGAAALPLTLELLEMGPYIDLDAVEWRAELVSLTCPAYNIQISDVPVLEAPLARNLEDAGPLGHKYGSVLWLRSLRRFAAAFESLDSGKQKTVGMARSSINACWTLPLLAYEASHADEIAKAEIDREAGDLIEESTRGQRLWRALRTH